MPIVVRCSAMSKDITRRLFIDKVSQGVIFYKQPFLPHQVNEILTNQKIREKLTDPMYLFVMIERMYKILPTDTNLVRLSYFLQEEFQDLIRRGHRRHIAINLLKDRYQISTTQIEKDCFRFG